jgi:hypothetical protein
VIAAVLMMLAGASLASLATAASLPPPVQHCLFRTHCIPAHRPPPYSATVSCMTVTFRFGLIRPETVRIIDRNDYVAFSPETDIRVRPRETYVYHLQPASRDGHVDEIDLWSGGIPTVDLLPEFLVSVNCK